MRTLSMMFWKFLPPYVTDPKKMSFDTILARGDRLLKSNMWRESFLKRRCLIPVDSFIEWERPDPQTKLPWMFAMKDDELFALAAVWRHWYGRRTMASWWKTSSPQQVQSHKRISKWVSLRCFPARIPSRSAAKRSNGAMSFWVSAPSPSNSSREHSKWKRSISSWTELRSLRSEFNAHARETGERLSTLEQQTNLLVGNGQPGRVGKLEAAVQEWRWWLAGYRSGRGPIPCYLGR